eukprot:4180631-Amphidinium_carterae.1
MSKIWIQKLYVLTSCGGLRGTCGISSCPSAPIACLAEAKRLEVELKHYDHQVIVSYYSTVSQLLIICVSCCCAFLTRSTACLRLQFSEDWCELATCIRKDPTRPLEKVSASQDCPDFTGRWRSCARGYHVYDPTKATKSPKKDGKTSPPLTGIARRMETTCHREAYVYDSAGL